MGWRDKVVVPLALTTALAGCGRNAGKAGFTEYERFFAAQVNNDSTNEGKADELYKLVEMAAGGKSFASISQLMSGQEIQPTAQYKEHKKMILNILSSQPIGAKTAFQIKMDLATKKASEKIQQIGSSPSNDYDRQDLVHQETLLEVIAEIQSAMATGRSL